MLREPREWNEDYILNLPVGEFDWLEIKGRRGLDLSLSNVREKDVRQNLSKAISAFANSGGGVLVFGLQNPASSWIIDDGGIDMYFKKPTTREWLEDVIPTLVDGPLNKFNVYVIQKESNKSGLLEGRGLFVIDVGDSEQAPHQADDNKYYIRVGGKSRPVGHKVVSDIFGRQQYPRIELEFGIKFIKFELQPPLGISSPFLETNKKTEYKTRAELIINARNAGRILARYMNCSVFVPKALIAEYEIETYKEDDFVLLEGIPYIEWGRKNTERDPLKHGLYGVEQYGPSWFDPILPGLAYSWDWDISAEVQLDELSDIPIYWEVYADNAPPQKGTVKLSDISVYYENE
jgi:hypothetical protein